WMHQQALMLVTNIVNGLLSYVVYQTVLVRMLQCHLIILLILLLKMLPALLWKCWIMCKNHSIKEPGGRVIFQVFLLRVLFNDSLRMNYTGKKIKGGLYFPLYKKLRSEEHTSELQSRFDLVCRLLLEKKKN